ncbi:Uncharacterized protein dnm_015150 [Desulfonema magnum]|uniref:Uncharacterized protein n=1 Tax=Desulfonema magnum TaxID=45655 RepID=A0A975BGW0_9BACT|nr:Uncharacterized protein dnm_015150 [Desulfonema magnum]
MTPTAHQWSFDEQVQSETCLSSAPIGAYIFYHFFTIF